ncbi:leucine-rich repeat receptor protein kinase HPCA1-like isoform X2 [Impatiens glandulifera]|uniref:leucine-rich repeat receptor protein kinase HPCA1-like isoform X2 n=1 Tax=Impatiens glandulifera TaxID=253017 RepID=UPI001FB0E3CB|nr:leucine-rich repeat receptor protein kinase HPCA1-like isoform X2 [Impatiens glandulifera]
MIISIVGMWGIISMLFLVDSEGGLPIGKLDMKQRIVIALGAAKGLQHLHSLDPPLFHMHFRTRNVLLDENFVAKVSDFGVISLLLGDRGGSSSTIDYFRDPELRHSEENFSERSDVYSFGVFLLELISGREDENIVSQARESSVAKDFVDKMAERTMIDGAAEKMMGLALVCVGSGVERPTMEKVVEQLERILEREIGPVLESRQSGEIGLVTLGSELFK